PRRPEHALPLHAEVPELLVGGAPAAADPGELTDEVLGEPRPHLVAEGRFIGRVAKVHLSAPSSGGRGRGYYLTDRSREISRRGRPGGRGARRRARRCRGRPGGTPSRRRSGRPSRPGPGWRRRRRWAGRWSPPGRPRSATAGRS